MAKETARTHLPSPDDIILSAYFGKDVAPRSLASAIRRLNVQGKQLGHGSPTLLDAAVATLLLRPVRDHLPQWAVVRDGQVTLGRERVKAVRRSTYRPRHLFTINWGDSAPGISWPVAYYATKVFAFRAVVVTASADGTDANGFTDFAIGHFPVDEDLLGGARRIIAADWGRVAAVGQERWAYLFYEGLVSAAQADEWAAQVWPQDEVEDESEDENEANEEDQVKTRAQRAAEAAERARHSGELDRQNEEARLAFEVSGDEAFSRQDYSAAFTQWRFAAARGSATAHWKLAMLFLRGRGVTRDVKEAAFRCHQAAEAGHASAQIRMARACEAVGDRAKADRWYRLAKAPGVKMQGSRVGRERLPQSRVQCELLRQIAPHEEP